MNYSASYSSHMGVGPMIVMFAIAILMIASMWKIFQKAGQPGWASIIPIYNMIVMLQIARKPVWWIVLFLIPVVSFVILIITVAGIASNFGKSGGFVVGMIFLPVIFYPILAFDSSQYLQPMQPPGFPMARANYPAGPGY